MESLSDNWLQWMEMIWSVLKQMRFAFAWVCCDNSNLAWFVFFVVLFQDGFYICMHVSYSFNTGT